MSFEAFALLFFGLPIALAFWGVWAWMSVKA